LSRVDAVYIVPQMNVYGGEGFDEAGEAFFGNMTRRSDRQGRPLDDHTLASASAAGTWSR
jgi:hypothetical protein